MANYVITIARSFGSGGKAAGVELARRLGIPCYENEILDMASEASGINAKFFYENNEKIRRQQFFKMLSNAPRTILKTVPSDKEFLSNDSLFGHQAELIRYLALNESCIIVGKAADYVLGDKKNVYRFFIDAPLDACVERIRNKMDCSEKEARDLVTKTNKYRSDYYKYYTGHEWKDPANYDMMINSAKIGQENIALLIETLIRMKNNGRLPNVIE